MAGNEPTDHPSHTLMKTSLLWYLLICSTASWAADAPPPGQPAPPPSSPALRSAAELEKLVAPIALYADPLIATLLPASVYPLEIVQAARFVANTNNLPQLEAQPWDENVKAVARVPALIQKMNDDLPWTIELGEAFLAQDKDVMDTIQDLRAKAQKAGTLQTTQQQVVVVTNMVVQTTVEQRVVVVTNTVVQIQPSSPEVVYVPTYHPYSVYYPPPSYVYDPYAPLVTFAAGVAVGAIIANNCDWHSGGIYVGHHGAVVWGGGGYGGDVDIDIDIDNNFNRNNTVNNSRANTTGAGQKWQPDQNRVRTSGSPTAAASVGSREARGYSSAGARPSTPTGAAARPTPSTGMSGARPTTGTAAARPSTGVATARPSAGTTSARSSAAAAPANRPSASPGVASSPSRSAGGYSSSSAFGGVSSGAGARDYSSRGASSRSGGGGFSGGSRGGGGGRGRR